MKEKRMYKVFSDMLLDTFSDARSIINLNASLHHCLMTLDDSFVIEGKENPLRTLSYVLADSINDFYFPKKGKKAKDIFEVFKTNILAFFEDDERIIALNRSISELLTYLQEINQLERVHPLALFSFVLVETIIEYMKVNKLCAMPIAA